MKLKNKITLFFIIIIIIIILFLRFLVIDHLSKTIESQIAASALDVAFVVADNPVVQSGLISNDIDSVQKEVEKFRKSTRFQYIIVMDNSSIQYSHPNSGELGKIYSRGGEEKAIKDSESYSLISTNPVISNIRAFTPVYNDNVQIGAVLVATINDRVQNEVLPYRNDLKKIFIFALILGVIGAAILSFNIKKQIFGLEPEEIALLLAQKEKSAKLAIDLNNSREIIKDIRAQNHEFQNKLHTISGLIQLEEYKKAIEYIENITNTRNDFLTGITSNILHPHVAAILLSKYNKALENKIQFEIDENSSLSEIPSTLSEDDITSIIGNLIENSIEELVYVENGILTVRLNSDEDFMNIIIQDNGRGIDRNLWDQIFQKGYSNKNMQRGYGLWIVKTLIEKANGTISLISEGGTTWNICIPMKEGYKNDYNINS